MLVGLRLWLCPIDGGNRLLPEPVGQRPATKRCTKSAPWRSRRLVVEVLSPASARRAACSNAQPAIGAATVTSAS
jgi:hypothetical protein